MACFLQNKTVISVFVLMSVILAPFCLSQQAVYAASNQKETSLNQAIEEALGYNPEFSKALHSKLVADEQLKQSKALFLPSLELRAEAGYDATKTPVIDNKELYKQQVSLIMTQLLFDGPGSNNKIKGRRARVRAAEYQRFETAELIALEVTNNFLNILRQRELMEIAEVNIAEHNEILKKIRYGEEQGRFNIGDLAQAKSRAARAQVSFETMIKSLAEADAAYQRIVGTSPSGNMRIPEFDASKVPDSVKKLIEQAQETSPVLAAFRAKIDAAKADYMSVKASYFPTVELKLSGTKGENLGGIPGGEKLGSAMVVMRWNLFNGGADNSRIKIAFHEKEIAQYNEIDVLHKLKNEIQNTWVARDVAAKQIEEFEKQVIANRKVTEVYSDQFELNRRSLLDLLNTQNELFISKSNRINAFYSKLFADFRLISLRGDFLKTLGIRDPFKARETKKITEREVEKAPKLDAQKVARLKDNLLGNLGIKESLKEKTQGPQIEKEPQTEKERHLKKMTLIPKNEKAAQISMGEKMTLIPKNEKAAQISMGEKMTLIPKSKKRTLMPNSEKITKKAAKIKEIRKSTPVANKPPQIPGKNYYIQLGAYKNPLEAKRMLGIISEENADLLEDVIIRIKRADLRKRGIYHRLLAGPLTEHVAMKRCIEIKARNTGGCFIVKR